ncbi:aspartate/glutamate racemase family protein [Cobetia sp. 1AS1]|uniref:aspartate/glutamate racemase family protein n=1 Tax=Cobetia sp. 1AS1 TaxID=3040016 RepID=UPI0024486E7D|nr:aspartate/glutamate racemase family protein [Cobetia sp. 1AS1]
MREPAMLRLKVINPNTSQAMSQQMAHSLQRQLARDVHLEVLTAEHGAPSIETAVEEAMAVVALLALIARDREGLLETPPADGYLLACFGDPGLEAARELSPVPVIGIAQAAMHMATLAAPSFAIVTSMTSTLPMSEQLLERYAMRPLCKALLACDVPVLALSEARTPPAPLLERCEHARASGAGSIVLGCAAMGPLRDAIASELGLPVVDPLLAGRDLLLTLMRQPAVARAKQAGEVKPLSGVFARGLAAL